MVSIEYTRMVYALLNGTPISTLFEGGEFSNLLPHQVLGITPNASKDEIKSAYRNLAAKYHPDRNPGNLAAAERMKQINWAYHKINDLAPVASVDRGSQNIAFDKQRGGPIGWSYSPIMKCAWCSKPFGDSPAEVSQMKLHTSNCPRKPKGFI